MDHLKLQYLQVNIKPDFVNPTRHVIYRLNLNYKVRFHLIIIDLNNLILKIILLKSNLALILGCLSGTTRYLK